MGWLLKNSTHRYRELIAQWGSAALTSSAWEASSATPGSNVDSGGSAAAAAVVVEPEVTVGRTLVRSQSLPATSYATNERGRGRRLSVRKAVPGAQSALLRIIHINDVYELDNLPRLSTLVKRASVGCNVGAPRGSLHLGVVDLV